ncbi:MAG TPA: type II toxin-antitoxin system RelE/ParE family toxin [Allosphingosinicella sp.]|nr:type II toxin-antitoxin system RelE/ParE family toxin [Allosphingosinicella sp.]
MPNNPAGKAFDPSPSVLYKGQRFEVRITEAFESWLDGLRDHRGRARMLNQLRKLGDGNFGNAKSLGEGVHELRMDFGPGYRAYFINRNDRLILLLCGGDKSSQKRDIALAREMAKGDFDGIQDEGV